MENSSPKALTHGELKLIYIKSYIKITNILKRMQNCRFDEFKDTIYKPWAKYSFPGITDMYNKLLAFANTPNNKSLKVYDPNHKDGDPTLKKILFMTDSYESTAKDVEDMYYYDENEYSKAFPISKEQISQNNLNAYNSQLDYIKTITGITDTEKARGILTSVFNLINLEPTIRFLKQTFLFNEPFDAPGIFAEEYRKKVDEYNTFFKQIADVIDNQPRTDDFVK